MGQRLANDRHEGGRGAIAVADIPALAYRDIQRGKEIRGNKADARLNGGGIFFRGSVAATGNIPPPTPWEES